MPASINTQSFGRNAVKVRMKKKVKIEKEETVLIKVFIDSSFTIGQIIMDRLVFILPLPSPLDSIIYTMKIKLPSNNFAPSHGHQISTSLIFIITMYKFLPFFVIHSYSPLPHIICFYSPPPPLYTFIANKKQNKKKYTISTYHS